MPEAIHVAKMAINLILYSVWIAAAVRKMRIFRSIHRLAMTFGGVWMQDVKFVSIHP